MYTFAVIAVLALGALLVGWTSGGLWGPLIALVLNGYPVMLSGTTGGRQPGPEETSVAREVHRLLGGVVLGSHHATGPVHRWKAPGLIVRLRMMSAAGPPTGSLAAGGSTKGPVLTPKPGQSD